MLFGSDLACKKSNTKMRKFSEDYHEANSALDKSIDRQYINRVAWYDCYQFPSYSYKLADLIFDLSLVLFPLVQYAQEYNQYNAILSCIIHCLYTSFSAYKRPSCAFANNKKRLAFFSVHDIDRLQDNSLYIF